MNIKAIVAQFDLQTSWFLNALENISEEESCVAFSENLNPKKWVAGHLTVSRMIVYSLTGGNEPDKKYQSHFGKGTSNTADSFPAIGEIKAEWIAVSERLKTSLLNLPEEKLLARAPFQTSIPDQTLAGLIAYFAIHESFHIGQISVCRKLIGKPAMAMGRQ